MCNSNGNGFRRISNRVKYHRQRGEIDTEFCPCRLFATLDPTIRRFPLASGNDALLADTVGFISELPTHLIEAFKVLHHYLLHMTAGLMFSDE